MNWTKGCRLIAVSLAGVLAVFCFYFGYINPHGEDAITVRLLTAFVSASIGYCFWYIVFLWVCKFIKWIVLGLYGITAENKKVEKPKDEQK